MHIRTVVKDEHCQGVVYDMYRVFEWCPKSSSLLDCTCWFLFESWVFWAGLIDLRQTLAMQFLPRICKGFNVLVDWIWA